MCCIESTIDFGVTQKLVEQNALTEFTKNSTKNTEESILSSYPYCISLGEMDEERKANVEDEEMRCAQELYEGYRADEVAYPVVKTLAHGADEQMLEENQDAEIEQMMHNERTA